ncbi:DUF1223 domain-containing protein [Pelagovum pacificum]|uniref:DUF1223 domain-containing protein n=1 Tax=Pelagovum pacificum TaxID=2588711 RepID=A0A5C5GHR2_9RHOB|nr:DUF1223 domain-containing protein [Pelagovum pacificum]
MVVELFTSQGCSSCPPADSTLKELSTRHDVLALALHVDYWDYIGWTDEFADPAYTLRQKNYAIAAGERMIYTPQMIIGGVDHVIGNRPMEVMDRISAHSDRDSGVEVSMRPEGDEILVLVAGQMSGDRPLLVQLVRFRPEETVDIERGENAGHTYSYANIVTSWEVIGSWNGHDRFEARVPRGDTPAAVIVQQEGPGQVVAAAKLGD